MSSAKDVNNLLSWGENWLFHYSGVKNTNRVEARVLKPISTSKLLSPTPAEIAGGRRHQHMTAISPQSSIFTSPYLLSSFVNCYWATWRCLHHHRRAVVGFFLLCGFVLLFRFPPRLINAPLPSQIRWCCRDLQRTRAARTHTHTHTHTHIRRFSQEAWEVFHQQLHRITNRARRWTEEKSLPAKCSWVVYGSEGAERDTKTW